MKKSKRSTGILVNALCVLVSLAALAFIVPAAFGLQRYVIAGGSMTGSISLGSVAFEEVVSVDELRVGDVITYLPPADAGVDNLVTHRIVSIKGDTFRTKGDANAGPDPWTFQLVSGTQPRVVFHVPLVGYPLLALQDRDTRMLALGGPAAVVFLLALAELLGLRRRRRVEAPVRPVTAPSAPSGPVRRVLVPAPVPAQPEPDDAGRPRRRARRQTTSSPVTVVPEDVSR
ncbi:MAG TPA: signal peptidase I [Marmoricola sp.]|jgi:signal peptidase I|nr:signal peptidase I [Marmoricola sp.]